MIIASITSVNASGAPLPEHSLSIEFDLQNNRLTGLSNIEIPANSNINLQLTGLTIKEIMVNNKEFISDTEISSLSVPAADRAQQIIIAYEKNCRPAGNDPAQDLVGPDGITLTGLWHPLADQDMRFQLTAIVPAGFSAVSEAEEISSQAPDPAGRVKQLRFNFPYALRSLHFVAGPYVVSETVFAGDRILATYFFNEDQELAADYRDQARRYLDRYEKLLGPYPYRRFAIVENRLPSGYAMPTFTLLGQAVVRLPFIKDSSLGHEILHAWFGNSVRVDSGQGNWAEGLTAYLADHAFAEELGNGAVYRKEQLIKYESYVHDDNGISVKEFAGADGSTGDDQLARAVGYGKAGMFFHMLKNELGEEIFYESLRKFYAAHKHEKAGWAEIMASCEEASGRKLADFFSQWLLRTDLPRLVVKDLALREEERGPLLSCRLVQENDSPYQLTVPVTVVSRQGRRQEKIIMTGPETAVEIPLDTMPTELIIDENYDLARRLAPAELPPTWSRFEGAAVKIVVPDPQADPELFAPFIEELQNSGSRIVAEQELTDQELNTSAVLFLGTDGAVSRSLFAKPEHPAAGFIVDLRQNPLQPDLVVALVSAQDRAQLVKGLAKLPHYRKYSYLHFLDGRSQEKRLAASEAGLRYELDQPPPGIESAQARTFDEIMKKLAGRRVIYIGETHTSYEDHQLQLRIIRALYEQDPRLAIGMEMFTRPTQQALDEYIAGDIDEKSFLRKSGYFKIWQYDYNLYRGIINYARHHRLPVIALNLEKDIVSNVFKDNGALGLAAEEKKELPPDRNLDVPGYRERLVSAFQMHSSPDDTGGKFEGFFQAQALWDETMAESAAAYLLANPDDRLVVIAGRGHVVKDSGIPLRVARRVPVSQAVVVNADGRELDPSTVDFLFASTPAALPEAVKLGVMLRENDNKDGLLVVDLSPSDPAIKAGIRKNDLIVALDGEPVKSIEDVKIALLFKKKNDRVLVGVRRPFLFFPDRDLEIEVQL